MNKRPEGGCFNILSAFKIQRRDFCSLFLVIKSIQLLGRIFLLLGNSLFFTNMENTYKYMIPMDFYIKLNGGIFFTRQVC